MYSGKETNMDEAKQDQEGGAGLHTLGLACCIGISVCGTYTDKSEPGEIRHNAFLAHLADGPAMEETWQSLKRKVDGAKKNGLCNLRIMVCVVDPSTLGKDEAMCWSRAMIEGQHGLNHTYVNKAAGLLLGQGPGPGPGSKVVVHRHHINEDVDMVITRDRRTLIHHA